MKMSMYGTRDAAANWAAEYGATLIAAGYVQGISSPCIFHHSKFDTTILVHGDDFVGSATQLNSEGSERLSRTSTS